MVKAKKMELRKETLRHLDGNEANGPENVTICTARASGCASSDCSGHCTAC